MRLNGKAIQSFLLRHGYLLIAAAWLITISFLVSNYWRYTSTPNNVQRLLENSIQKREAELNKFLSDSVALEALSADSYDDKTLKDLVGPDKDFYVFLFQNKKETFWSTSHIVFDTSITRLKSGTYFKQTASGYYEVVKRDFGEDRFLLGFIPVKEEYEFENSLLPDRYYKLARIGNNYEVNIEGEGWPVESASGKILFHFQNRDGTIQTPMPMLSGILIALAILLVLVFLNQFTLLIGSRYGRIWGIALLTLIFLILRWLSYRFNFPLAYRQYPLFDVTIYASNPVLRSLGDLLVNVILVSWIVFYAFLTLKGRRILPRPLNRKTRLFLLFATALLFYFNLSYIIRLIGGMVIDSQISFDVTNFFSLDVFSFTGFIILGYIGTSFYALGSIVNQFLNELNGGKLEVKYLLITLAGLAWLFLAKSGFQEIPLIWIMLWVIGFLFLLDKTDKLRLVNFNIGRLILWLFILTISITALLIFYNNEREKGYREQLADRLVTNQDPTFTFSLSLKNMEIEEDSQVIAHFSSVLRSEKNLSKYLKNRYFQYLDFPFRLNLFLLNVHQHERDSLKRAAFNAIMEGARPTDFDGIYFHQDEQNHFSYLALMPIMKADSLLGYLSYQLIPDRIDVKSGIFRLFSEGTDILGDNLKRYSYALYDNDRLIYYKNEFPYPFTSVTKKLPSQYQFDYKKDFSELRYESESGRGVILVKERRVLVESMTLFAYLFVTFLLLFLFFNIVRILFNTRFKWTLLKVSLQMDIRNRIYAMSIATVTFIFITLGYSNIRFFINKYDSLHHGNLQKEMTTLVDRFEIKSDRIATKSPTENGGPNDWRLIAQDLVKDYDGDLNIFSLSGDLLFSNRDFLFDNKLLSRKMNPRAFYDLALLKQTQVIQKERIGDLHYLSYYIPLKNGEGETLAFLNRPYFDSQTDLKKEISDFLVTLINLNAFIFLLAGLLGILFTRGIMKPFTLIREKLGTVSLTGKNREIIWERNDEIGSLVSEYNKMVRKLKESASLLAKKEREVAWREMARQVAHEIKNPLTPMKLRLQYLQKAIESNSPNKESLTKDVAVNLIEQINHLSQIASDFSAFANITHAHAEELDLKAILESVVLLHQNYDNVEVKLDDLEEGWEIYADKTQMNRVFTNLIKNAIQAIPEDRKGKIVLSAKKESREIVVEIKDNGEGIPEDLKEKIFTPNFTTKSSGTGLGLAITRNIILNLNGEITFKTQQGKGTIFFVRLPLIDKNDTESKG